MTRTAGWARDQPALPGALRNMRDVGLHPVSGGAVGEPSKEP